MIRTWMLVALLLAAVFLGYSVGSVPPPPPVAIRVDAEPNVSLEIMRMQHEKEMQELRNKRPQMMGRGWAVPHPSGHFFATDSQVNSRRADDD